ncbi:hypothetical protein [Aliterella atlantica]|uniref:Uncharacterized protein n=1 Tax=Aliterella atlantica CENA595 TaxID=1618023 RepID=A0A0D8ZR97_9CYAN|nr:hypothetical protein [Aliterella atlantica]KJH71240.1 hypothetical protein UH38_13175 [Aliterella atlantica CENA595]
MNLENIEIGEIKNYIQQEKAKGRSVRDILKEIVAVRSDVTVLSHDPTTGRQQILESLKQYQN